MYIFEWITKYIEGKKFKKSYSYSPDNQDDIIENVNDCVHLFLPLDSTEEFFACKYCGLTVSKKDLNKIK